jgi:small subunit ribosomal protein S7
MPRKVTKSLVRTVPADRLYNSTPVQKLINRVMLDGTKQLAERLVYGGANYQIPFEVKGQRQQHLTTMWFVEAARARSGMSMEDRIAQELVDAYNGTGNAVKKKEDTHRMAEANRAFAHFART